MKLLVHVLGLLCCSLEARLGPVPGLKCLIDFLAQALLFQPKSTRNLLRGNVGLNLSVQLFSRALSLLLNHEVLLGDLHRGNRRITKMKTMGKRAWNKGPEQGEVSVLPWPDLSSMT